MTEDVIRDWVKYTINKYKERNFEMEDYITIKFVDDVIDMIEITLINEDVCIF